MRIAILADEHLLSGYLDAQALFPAHYDALQPDIAASAFDYDRMTVHLVRSEVARHVQACRPWDAILHVGDFTSGWRGYGLGHPSVKPLVAAAVAEYKSLAPFDAAWGDHDIGMKRQGGVSASSVRACASLSPLYWTRDIGGIQFIGVCASLEEEGAADKPGLVAEERFKQRRFVEQTLLELDGKRWVLVTHNLKLGALIDILAQHSDSLLHCLCGHYHAPWAGKLQQRMGFVKPFGAKAELRRKSVMIPSIAPLWWKGGAFAVAYVERGLMNLEYVHTPLVHELRRRIDELPFSRFHESITMVGKRIVRRRLGQLLH